jgi:lipid-A-disaccharide synthase
LKNWKKKLIGEKIALSDMPVVALLPGSRKQEILKKLPIMLKVSQSFLNYQFIVAKAPGVDESFYDEMLKHYPNVSYVANRTYDYWVSLWRHWLLRVLPHWKLHY